MGDCGSSSPFSPLSPALDGLRGLTVEQVSLLSGVSRRYRVNPCIWHKDCYDAVPDEDVLKSSLNLERGEAGLP